MKRREFISRTAVLAGSMYLSGCVSISRNDVAASNRLAFFSIENRIVNHPQGHRIGGQNALHILDTMTLDIQTFPLPMRFPHSFIQHPKFSNILIITPRDQPLALAFDISQGRVLQRLDLDRDRNFYGHGFFDRDGQDLFLTGYEKNGSGFLKHYAFEEGGRLREIGNIDSFGKAPHDVRLIRGGRVLLVANNGWSGRDSYFEKSITSMAYIDMKTRKLIEKIELPAGFLAFQHFESNDDGDFVVGCDLYGRDKIGAPGQSLLAYRKNSGPLTFLEMSDEMKRLLRGNILSLRWDQVRGKVVTTTPEGPVTTWDLEKMKAVRQEMNKTFPHGVEGGAELIIVTTSNSGIWQARLTPGSSEIAPLERLALQELVNISAHAKWLA